MIKFVKSITNITEGAMVARELIKKLVTTHLEIPRRLQNVATDYLMSLMLESPKHTQSFAAEVTGRNQAQFSRLLSNQKDLAKNSLSALGQERGKAVAKPGREFLVAGSTWTIAILIDATLHPRSSLHVQNSQRFNHGQGFVIGHQWTNIVVLINDRIIPLPPIPFWSKNECTRRKVLYKTEHERIKQYLETLNLSAVAGSYEEGEVVVLMDAGYDNKKLQSAVLEKDWDFISALKTIRGARSAAKSVVKGKKKWGRIDDLFWSTRKQAPWKTVRIEVDGGKKRRRFRARKLLGFIKGVAHDVALVCSEKSGGTGRRFFACSKPDLDVGVIIRAYSKRWGVELFHRATKHQLGLLDAGVEDFDALTAHVHWVYCAYLLLHELEIAGAQSLLDKQRSLTRLASQAPWEKSLRKIIAAKNQCGGVGRQEDLLRMALQEAIAA